jgi:hypothetical protein
MLLQKYQSLLMVSLAREGYWNWRSMILMEEIADEVAFVEQLSVWN